MWKWKVVNGCKTFQDDAFSSLDNEVVARIFEKCIKDFLIKFKRTVILVTQKTQLVYSADYVSLD